MLYPIRMSLLCSQSSVQPAAAGQGQMGLPGSDPLKLDTEPDKSQLEQSAADMV